MIGAINDALGTADEAERIRAALTADVLLDTRLIDLDDVLSAPS